MLALSIYTAAFIAEIVRAGIQAVEPRPDGSGACAGRPAGQTLRLVVIPQAMRVIIPPLTSQYLNLTKNSSLAVAIGYPDLVAMGGTVLNQTGPGDRDDRHLDGGLSRTLSLLTSAFMNWFNSPHAAGGAVRR